MNQIFTLQNGWKSPFPYFPSIKQGLFGVPGNSLVLRVGLDKPRHKVKLWSNGGKNSKQMVVMPPFSIISIGSAHSKIRFYWLINQHHIFCFFMVNVGGYSIHLYSVWEYYFGNCFGPLQKNCLMTIVNFLGWCLT